MLRRKNNEWSLSPFKVRYTQRGKEFEEFTHDKQWWESFAQRWDHTNIIEFIDMIWTEDEKTRFEEIKLADEGFGDICAAYVLTGKFPDEESHGLKELQTKKENEKLGQDLSEREIQEIIQGQQISDLEIRLLMGGL